MDTKSNKEFESSVELINLIMSVCGSNVLQENWSTGIKRKCLRGFAIFAALSLSVMYAKAVHYHFHDFDKLSESLMTASSAIQATIKVLMVQISYKDLRDVVDMCRKFRIKFAGDVETEISSSTDMVLIRKVGLLIRVIYVFFCVSTVTLIFQPLFEKERAFPLFFYFPFCAPFQSPCYEFNYIYVGGIMFFIFMHLVLGLDCIYIFLICEMCLQFNIIKMKLSNVGKLEESKYDQEIKLLRQIQEMTQELSGTIKKINEIFSIIFLTQFLTTFGMLSVTLFIIATTGGVSEIGLLICIILQLLFYCFFGELLKHKMESLTFLLYDTEWYNLKIKERKSLMVMMSYSQIVPTMMAGGYAELSLATFMQILKTAYSYYTIMRDQQK